MILCWVLVALRPQSMAPPVTQQHVLHTLLGSYCSTPPDSNVAQKNSCHPDKSNHIHVVTVLPSHNLFLHWRCHGEWLSLNLTPWTPWLHRLLFLRTSFSSRAHLSYGSPRPLACFQLGPSWPICVLQTHLSALLRRDSPLRQWIESHLLDGKPLRQRF